MRESIKREYELDRTYDYGELDSTFVKKRARRRFRHQNKDSLKKSLINTLKDIKV